ncbi:hypothetical protein AB0F17_62310 [Nonomuraea sp. NPDC026600]|uniref:hypothetical protein n=1 Tax=Nonomuraea sp. NPDC026600 TaxID=3155363 RepID=UPI0033E2C8EE
MQDVRWERADGSDVTVFDILATHAFFVIGASRETRQVVLDFVTWHAALSEAQARRLRELLQKPDQRGTVYLEAGHRLIVAPNPANGTVGISMKGAFLPDLTTPHHKQPTVIPAEHMPLVADALDIALAAACPRNPPTTNGGS